MADIQIKKNLVQISMWQKLLNKVQLLLAFQKNKFLLVINSLMTNLKEDIPRSLLLFKTLLYICSILLDKWSIICCKDNHHGNNKKYLFFNSWNSLHRGLSNPKKTMG
ncbi:MAG: hypothetical protein ACI8Y9_001537 [Paracoccaceae bacterium]|jgi:hypothetical protein